MKEGYCEIRRHLGGDLPLGATERTVEILEEMLGMSAAADHPQNAKHASRP